ncbi:MAG: hypothetical protein ABR574_13660 [Cryomorphaceae bacterium]
MKRRTLLFLSVFALISTSVAGQKDFEPGYIVSLQNDTISGQIKDRKSGMFPDILKKIQFKSDGALFKRKYSATKILGYKVGDRVYESVGIDEESHFFKTQYFVSPNADKTFLRVMETGTLRYYHWEHIDQDNNTIDYIPFFYLEGRGEMVRATQGVLGLKKKLLSEYFYDCPELVQKIENKQITAPFEVVDFFRERCGGGE